MSDSTLRAVLGRLIRACFVKVDRVTKQFALHPLDQTYCYNQISPAAIQDLGAAIEPPPFTLAVLHERAANYYRNHRLPRSAWRRVADLEPQLNEFKHRVLAGEEDEAAQVLLDIDRDHLWEWGDKDLLRQLYLTLEDRVHDAWLAHQVARRRAWLMFYEVPDEAYEEFTRLLAAARRLGLVKEEADALDDLAQCYRLGGRDLQQGAEHPRQALALYRQIGDRRGEADALGGLGAIFTFTQNDPEQAVACLQAAANIQRELGNGNDLSFVLTMLGLAYENLGALEKAVEVGEEAVRMALESNGVEALGRAYSTLAQFYVARGDIERGRACIEEAMTSTRHLSGVPMTENLMFSVCMTAMQMALANDTRSGIELLERAIHDASALLPQMVLVGNLFLSLVSMLDGDLAKARALLPPEPEQLLSIAAIFSFWIGVLLIKTGEAAASASFLGGVLEVTANHGIDAQFFRPSELGIQVMRALAYAGLALLKRDPAMAATAAELIRGLPARRLQTGLVQTDLLHALTNLLLQEPGGEILLPIRDILASTTARN